MKVRIVRHGETDWNKEGRLQGSMDRPLNLFGVQQAHTCAKHLANEKFDRVFSSPLSRAYQTAEIISSKMDVEIVKVPDIEEIDLGEWQGLKWSEIRLKFSNLLADFERGRDLSKIYKGESLQDQQKRAIRFLTSLEQYEGENILVVSHGGLIKTLICHILGLDLGKRDRFGVSNLSISTLLFSKKQGWTVSILNEYNYLDGLFSSGGQI